MSRLLFGCPRLCHLARTNGRARFGWVPPCMASFSDVLSLPFQVHGIKTDPSSETEEREVGNERVRRIAEEIVSLNLLEIADLTELLHKRLRTPPGMMGMQMGMPQYGQPFPSQAPAAAAAPAAEAPKAAEKTEFSVKLASFDAASKIKVIKEVRAATNLGLKEAKELVSLPGTSVRGGGRPMSLVDMNGMFSHQLSACVSDGPSLRRLFDPSVWQCSV